MVHAEAVAVPEEVEGPVQRGLTTGSKGNPDSKGKGPAACEWLVRGAIPTRVCRSSWAYHGLASLLCGVGGRDGFDDGRLPIMVREYVGNRCVNRAKAIRIGR